MTLKLVQVITESLTNQGCEGMGLHSSVIRMIFTVTSKLYSLLNSKTNLISKSYVSPLSSRNPEMKDEKNFKERKLFI